MPKLENIKKVLLIGSGPVTIGQGTEYDYALFEAANGLKGEGIEVIIVDSNPATLASEPEFCNQYYPIPLVAENIEKLIQVERPDAICFGFGGQTAFNLLQDLAQRNVFEKYQVKLDIQPEVAYKLKDRKLLQQISEELGMMMPKGAQIKTVTEGIELSRTLDFPLVIRSVASFAGIGYSIAYNQEELEECIEAGLNASPFNEVVLENLLDGWNEIECEVLGDGAENLLIVSDIENIDPVGVHSGDSIAVIPAQGLTSELRFQLENYCRKIIARLQLRGICNIKFAINQVTNQILVLGINPRFTRSSALVSNVTGVPLAALAIKIMLGYTLPEMGYQQSVFTGFDYVAIKFPSFDLSNSANGTAYLGVMMQATGQVVALGANLKEALQKAIRSAETKRKGFGVDGFDQEEALSAREMKEKLINPNPERLYYLRLAFKKGMKTEEIHSLSKMPKWFLKELSELVQFEKELTTYAIYNITPEILRQAKEWGYADSQLAYLFRVSEQELRAKRVQLGIIPSFQRIGDSNSQDSTAYFSTYRKISSNLESDLGQKIIILGNGIVDISVGSDFDYSVVKASLELDRLNKASIIVSCNPSSVATNNRIAKRVFIEPLILENLLNIVELEKPIGVITQFLNQDCYAFSKELAEQGVKILGTDLEDLTEVDDHSKYQKLLKRLNVLQPETVKIEDGASVIDSIIKLGYPVILKHPSQNSKLITKIIFSLEQLKEYLAFTKEQHDLRATKLVEDAIGVSVDAIGDGKSIYIAALMEQIEEAGVAFGDCGVSMPPYSLGTEVLAKIKEITQQIGKALAIKGLLTVRFAIKHETVYVLEILPQVTFSAPFVRKATGIDWISLATAAIVGDSIVDRVPPSVKSEYFAVKEAVFSYNRSPKKAIVLGPEKQATGMVMGLDPVFGIAFIKAQLAAGENIPSKGQVFLSIRNEDKRVFLGIARQLIELGFKLTAPDDTADILNRNGIPCETVYRPGEGRPNIIDKIKNKEIQWVINTPSELSPKRDEEAVRIAARMRGIPVITMVSGASAAVQGLQKYINEGLKLVPLYNHK